MCMNTRALTPVCLGALELHRACGPCGSVSRLLFSSPLFSCLFCLFGLSFFPSRIQGRTCFKRWLLNARVRAKLPDAPCHKNLGQTSENTLFLQCETWLTCSKSDKHERRTGFSNKWCLPHQQNKLDCTPQATTRLKITSPNHKEQQIHEPPCQTVTPNHHTAKLPEN